MTCVWWRRWRQRWKKLMTSQVARQTSVRTRWQELRACLVSFSSVCCSNSSQLRGFSLTSFKCFQPREALTMATMTSSTSSTSNLRKPSIKPTMKSSAVMITNLLYDDVIKGAKTSDILILIPYLVRWRHCNMMTSTYLLFMRIFLKWLSWRQASSSFNSFDKLWSKIKLLSALKGLLHTAVGCHDNQRLLVAFLFQNSVETSVVSW